MKCPLIQPLYPPATGSRTPQRWRAGELDRWPPGVRSLLAESDDRTADPPLADDPGAAQYARRADEYPRLV